MERKDYRRLNLLAMRRLDSLIIGLMAIVAFLLGCYEMADSDVWWHISGGRWILEHGRVPDLDPFTFGSQNCRWVDIHWAFEVLVAILFRQGGVAALVLLAASAGCLAFLTAATARHGSWPIALTVLLWTPALILMSWRFDPRPEIFSLLFLAVYLAILWRVDRRPALMWYLPFVQVLWVNMQGLFILGPVVLAFFLVHRGVACLRQRLTGTSECENNRHWWGHIAGASLAVGAACFLNPYGIEGVRFPLDLFPKVASPGNVYKEYIDELASPSKLIDESSVHITGNWYVQTLYLLLLALPFSFLVPGAWRVAQVHPAREVSPGPSQRLWLSGLIVIAGLFVANALALSPSDSPPWAVDVGQRAPLALVLVAVLAAISLHRHSWSAATIVVLGGLAEAAWMLWLRQEFLGSSGENSSSFAAPPGWLMAILGLATTALVYWQGADLFRLLLASAFGYLAFQAIQNGSRFGLVAGMVMTWNLGEWIASLVPALATKGTTSPRRIFPDTGGRGARETRLARISVRLVLMGFLVLWIFALATDRYHGWTGERRHLSLAEQPFEFAHEAIRFCGQSEQPERALVYDLGQTGLFDFYNAPAHKVFMDGRLEMPERSTFETYVAIEQGLGQQDATALKAIEKMGRPLVVLTHLQNFNGEALLLTSPDWRCTCFDALASVFEPSDGLADRAYPAVDFVRLHFQQTNSRPVPDVPGAAFRETRALYNLGTALRRTPASAWAWRIPVLLRALDRAGLSLQEDPHRAATWTLLGGCQWNLVPNSSDPPPTPTDPWMPAVALPWAQSTYCFRRALEMDPNQLTTLRYLSDSYRYRGMADVQLALGKRLLELPQKAGERSALIGEFRMAMLSAPTLRRGISEKVERAVPILLACRQPGHAFRRVESALESGTPAWSWPFADQAAALCMHMGQPAAARQVWQAATSPPSEAVRLARLASTYWVERDFETARRTYQESLKKDPQLGEAWWGLAMMSAQLGQAQSLLDACRQGSQRKLSKREQEDLRELERLASGKG
jgi:tetratricopeptide (TPR) repeat protein